MSAKKLPVCINVLPTLDYLELVQYDEKAGEIDKANSLPCQFDLANRTMGDRDQMVQTIRDLYNMNRIPFNTPAVLVLPSFLTREIELPAEFSREELRFALVSEAERFYLFKKNEPQIDWLNLDSSHLLYSAYPKTEIEKYTQIFQELRIPLLAIELNYFSILRGLISSTGALTQELEENGRWCLLVISDTSFFAAIQAGAKILKTTDAPLSISDEDENAAIAEIQQDFGSFTDLETFTKLVVVNNANRINTETLLSKLGFQGELVLVEQNILTLKSRGAQDGQFPCSLEAIGGIFYTQLPEFPRLNLLPDTGEDVIGILQYRKTAMKWMLIANAAMFLIFLLIWGLMTFVLLQKDSEHDRVLKQISQVGVGGNPVKIVEIERKKYIKGVVEHNVKVNNFMVAVGKNASGELWLTRIELDASGADTEPFKININGESLDLAPVLTLRNALNTLATGTSLEVGNPIQATSPDGQAYYTWGIQNKAVDATTASSSAPTPNVMPPAMPGGQG